MKKAKEIKPFLAQKYYKNRCYVCHRKFGKGFAFHHLWYESDDAIYKNFKSPDLYHQALMPLIISNTKRFLLLCKGHHRYVEWAASIKDESKWKRFVRARKMTRT